MEKLTKEEVKHVADLARLNINEDEFEKYSVQLNDILTEIDKILSVEINENEEILISTTDASNKLNKDEVGEMLSREDIFKNVKNKSGDYIIVPKVLND